LRPSGFSQITGLGGENITFLGGSLCGGGAWVDNSGGPTAGETPAAGYVVVYNASGGMLAQFALPFNIMFKVQDVNKIVVYAETPDPYPGHAPSDNTDVMATVFWTEG
jgi:hypothetical protein